MKQVDKVSIGGYAFTMESEAAQAARIYLEQLGDYYKSSEVMEGIEERMAELLLEKTPSEGVVDLVTVNGIIEILGRPERIEAEEPKKEDVPPSKDKPHKKLYRDMERAKVAGVCSGLSSYFNVDVAIFRLCFLVLTIVGLFGGLSISGNGLSLTLTGPFIWKDSGSMCRSDSVHHRGFGSVCRRSGGIRLGMAGPERANIRGYYIDN